MKFSIDRAILASALAHVQSVVERRNTIPILSFALIRAEGDRVSFSATDMDIAIQESVPAEISAPGTACVNASTLYDIVRKMKDGCKVEFESDPMGGIMKVKGGRSNFRMGTLPPDDFPAMKAAGLPVEFKVDVTALRDLIQHARFAISTEETRYYLNGIYLHATKSGGADVLRGVATDGHRLARVDMPLPLGAAGMPGVIVPRKTIAELVKLLDGAMDTVAVSLSSDKINFQFEHVTLTSKLIDGTFPDYERVIPQGNDKMVDVDRAMFVEAVSRVAVITTERAKTVKLTIGRDTVTISANSPETGSATEDMDLEYSGVPIEVGFNSRYLLDVMGQLVGDNARMAMADAASPVVITDVSDQGALYVIMPMRVS